MLQLDQNPHDFERRWVDVKGLILMWGAKGLYIGVERDREVYRWQHSLPQIG